MRFNIKQVLAAGLVLSALVPVYAGGGPKPGPGNPHGSSYHGSQPGHGYHYYHGYRYYGAWPYGYYVADGPTVIVNDGNDGYPISGGPESEEAPPPPPVRLAPPPPPTAATDVNTAAIRIRTAPTARVWFDGSVTTQTGVVRTFSTPPLDVGKTYAYSVRACWLEEGRPVVRARTVKVIPGETAELDLR